MFDTDPRHLDHPRHRQRHERDRGANRIPSWIFGRLDPFAAGRPSVRRGDVRSLILAVLQRQPMHGYQVIQELETQSGGRWRPSAGSVYPTLQQLEDEGIVRSSEVDGRRVYSLTDEGRTAAAATPTRRPRWADADASHDARDIRGLAMQLVGAVIQVSKMGSPKARQEARDILIDARRQMYRLLAEDVDEGTDRETRQPAGNETASANDAEGGEAS
jgi:DNA-binding PadR family transcriptional regulator